MIPAKLATPGLLKIKVFWNKGSGVINFINDATNIILSSSSIYIVDVVMWPNFGYSSIFMIVVIITQILVGFDQKTNFEGWPSLKFTNLRLIMSMVLKFYCSVAKGLTLKWLGVDGEGGWGAVNLTPPCGFLKTVSSKERVKPWFFVTLNIIIGLIFPENFFEIPQVFQKNFSVSIIYFHHFLVTKKLMTSARHRWCQHFSTFNIL